VLLIDRDPAFVKPTNREITVKDFKKVVKT